MTGSWVNHDKTQYPCLHSWAGVFSMENQMGRSKYRRADDANDFRIQRIYDLRLRDDDTVDHWQPYSQGGLHHENNLCVMHHALNTRKADMDPEEFSKFELNPVVYQYEWPELYFCVLPIATNIMWITEQYTALPIYTLGEAA